MKVIFEFQNDLFQVTTKCKTQFRVAECKYQIFIGNEESRDGQGTLRFSREGYSEPLISDKMENTVPGNQTGNSAVAVASLYLISLFRFSTSFLNLSCSSFMFSVSLCSCKM